RCGPIQDRLRVLVAEKLADNQRRLVELVTLSAELQRAPAPLEQHRPQGPCDDRCGCVSVGDEAEALAVTLTTKPDTAETPITCTLTPQSVSGRMDDWSSMLSHVTTRVAIPGGVRVGLDVD